MGLALSEGTLTDGRMLSATFTALLAGLAASLVFLLPFVRRARPFPFAPIEARSRSPP